MPIILKNQATIAPQKKEEPTPETVVLPRRTLVKQEGVQLVVNGKEKKFNKTSAYLLDMMSDDDK